MSEPQKFSRPLKKPPRGGGDAVNEAAEEPASPNLYVANCGPALGVSHSAVSAAFASFGDVVGVHPADESGARVVVCYAECGSARAAMEAWGEGHPCPELGDRVLHMQYSIPRPPRKIRDASIAVSLEASELGIPGVYLLHEFVSPKEEQELLAAVDLRPWKSLAKRRVQHYGYEFLYEIRNVDSRQFLGELPFFVSFIIEKLPSFPHLNDPTNAIVDQLTVNEYPPGVGLSPHIDTHSAFDESIFSLSLAGPCIMEFRKYVRGSGMPDNIDHHKTSVHCTNFERKAIFLPPRSMLLMSGEGRYAWLHYIPHHKVDIVGGNAIGRSSRRVSFTFRKIRREPCCCDYPEFCDSQREV